MKRTHLVLLLIMNLCWAGVYSAYKVIGKSLPGEGVTGSIVTLRFGLAGLCLLVAWPWLPGPAPRGRGLAVSGLMGFIAFLLGQRLQVYGNHIGSAGNSAVLMGLEPLVTSVAAGLFLREHIGPRRLAGFALGLCGVALLNGVWRADFRWTSLNASMIFISSFLCEAAYSVLGKPVAANASAMKMVAISLLVGTAANLAIDGPSTVAAARELPLGSWGLLLFLAIVCTALGYSLWFMVIRDCPINVAALTIFAQSVFGVILAALWLHERLHWGHFAGSLAIAAGLMVGLSRQIHS
ncbi:MAG: hypothetical protein C5B50_13050 [Verrucomicrobia bacterium]|nr:MAG: hypothetical protein C5B50_13050 [Verrucomicrobiota bacterium]